MTNTRNYGIDLLRILSMLFVVVLHCLGHGGVLGAAQGANSGAAWALEALAFCAVNCFVTISGYCSCESRFKCRRIFALWAEALFYSLAAVVFLAVYDGKTINEGIILKAFFPVLSNQWWFFTQYFALAFAMPFLNALLRSLGKGAASALIAAVFAVLTCLPLIAGADLFKLEKGYSFVWFCALYLVGGSLKKLENVWKPSKWASLATYLACAFATWLVFMLARSGTVTLDAFTARASMLYTYTSPTIFVASITLLLVFREIEVKPGKLRSVVSWVTPSVFAVYLISDHALIRAAFMKEAFVPAANLNPVVMLAIVIACACAVFVACVMIDKVRTLLFRLVRLDKLIKMAGEAADKRIGRIAGRFAHSTKG